MKKLSLLSLIALGLTTSLSPAIAHHLPDHTSLEITQNTVAPSLNNAKNLARQAAEEANGGLRNYRAEPSMHGKALDAPYVENTDGSYTFTFRGRRPEDLDFTYETEVTVAADGTVTMDYNGAPRGGTGALADTVTTVDLNQAKNLARQAAEQANGGLSQYRAESSMHGNAQDAPHVENPGGGYTFTFRGREPESLDFTFETEVAIAADGTVNILYNGDVRGGVTSLNTITTIAPVDLNQAKNLARQAAEEANGGLSKYRAESSMHGNPNDAPYVENDDGSFTFTFKGRRPESLDFTFESVVQVDLDRTVTIISNGER